MKHLGYLRNKKTKTKIYTDSVSDPKFIFFGAAYMHNATLCFTGVGEEYGYDSSSDSKAKENFFEDYMQVFQISFEVTDFTGTKSGGFMTIKDLDTGALYPIYNTDLAHLMRSMQNLKSEYLTQIGERIEGLFTTKTAGTNISLRLLDNGELGYLETI